MPAAGRQALVLLPEIALTAEFLTRVEARFGARPAEWHSGVTMTERRRCWRMVAEGGAQLVVGARSALFLPFRDLGLIVVDEEHDTSYKQEDGVLYNARDMAVLRASIAARAGGAGLGHAVARDLGQRRGGQVRAAGPDRALRRGGDAADAGDRHAPRGAAGGPLDLATRWRGRRGAASRRASRRSCSSTGAATRRSRSAGPAGTRSAATIATRGWSSTASASGWSATSAARPGRCPRPAPPAGSRASWPPVGPGVERLAEEAAARFPGGADRGAVVGPLRLGPRAEGRDRGDRGGARRTSSSARNWWPRGTTFRC